MKNKTEYTPIRFSHLTGYAGIGSILRSNQDKLVVLMDIRNWVDSNGGETSEKIPYVTRICKALNLAGELRMPPKAQLGETGDLNGHSLPAVLFPTYAICRKCHLLHNNPWEKQNKEYFEEVNCSECNGLLEQVTWCAVSDEGHLDEVPWHNIAHRDSKKTVCRIDFNAEYLRIKSKNDKKIVECRRCGSSNSFEKTRLKKLNKFQPWLNSSPPESNEDSIIEIMEVNDPRVYLPVRKTALVIPPESRIKKSTVVDRLYNNSKLLREIEDSKRPQLIKAKINTEAQKLGCTIGEFKSALEEIHNGYPFYGMDITVRSLLLDEYEAFVTPIEDLNEDEDFVTKHKTDEWKELGQLKDLKLQSIQRIVDKLIEISRLREIRIFEGFFRISSEKRENLVPPDIVGESTWLPAIELFGEGLFFALDLDMLRKWELLSGVSMRAEELSDRFSKSPINVPITINISARFVLLHTIAHLIIRELESISGYPTASLRERIYCDEEMSGILIYTAVPDVVGSLGGLVACAEPKEFLKILLSAFKHAEWCSLDPVCSEQTGQGPGWLNRAACHACTLLPETSCEYENLFLDRVFLRGNETLSIPNFLEFIGELVGGKEEI